MCLCSDTEIQQWPVLTIPRSHDVCSLLGPHSLNDKFLHQINILICVHQRVQDKVLLALTVGHFWTFLNVTQSQKYKEKKEPTTLKKTIIKIQLFCSPSLGLPRALERPTGKASL